MTTNTLEQPIAAEPVSKDRGGAPGRPGRGFRLGTLSGIEIRLDWSLIFIFVLISVNLGAGLFPAQHPDWGPVVVWTTAIAAAVLFLGSVLAHELAHALVGRRNGVPIDRITLFIFGGLAEMREEPRTPKAELVTTIVGPLTSLAIGVVALLLGAAASNPGAATDPLTFVRSLSPLASLLLWLGPVNVLLAVFNLLPGFPLDGGRVLRAVLWQSTGDFDKATRWAAGVGRGFALALMLLGIMMIFGQSLPLLGGGLAQGLWLLLIGWFLNHGAVASQGRVTVRRLFGDMPVSRLMRPAKRALPPGASLQAAADAFLDSPSDRCLPVVEQGRLRGLVCLVDLSRAPRESWSARTTAEVMTPVESLQVARPDDLAADAVDKLARADVDQLPVVDNGELRGLIRRADVMRWLELGAPAR